MADFALTTPDDPYPSFEAFLTDLMKHGAKYPELSVYSHYYNEANAEIQQQFEFEGKTPLEERSKPELKMLRGSSNLSCAGIVSLNLNGKHPVTPIPEERKSILRMGHILHAEVYARIVSALPPFVTVDLELPIKINSLDWWPQDHELVKDSGTVDIIIHVDEEFLKTEEATEWFANPNNIPARSVADVKSCSTYLYPKYGRTSFEGHENDIYGYVSQIALYSEVLGTTGAGGHLLFINRDRPGDDVLVKPISGFRLTQEVQQIKNRLQAAYSNTFRFEKAERFTFKEVGKLCGNWRKDQEGYCPHSITCMKRRSTVNDF